MSSFLAIKRGGTMRPSKLSFYLLSLFIAGMALGACQHESENTNSTATTKASPPGVQTLSVVARPQKIADLMKARGEQDQAMPALRIVSPAKGATINGSTV